MHYLRIEIPTTLRELARTGITYDSTLGYADQIGFRCGTCNEYQAVDPVTAIPINIKIRPLLVMDQTVINQRYMGLGCGADAEDKIFRIKERCRKIGGQFSMLWHNSTLVSKSQRRLYTAALQS